MGLKYLSRFPKNINFSICEKRSMLIWTINQSAFIYCEQKKRKYKCMHRNKKEIVCIGGGGFRQVWRKKRTRMYYYRTMTATNLLGLPAMIMVEMRGRPSLVTARLKSPLLLQLGHAVLLSLDVDHECGVDYKFKGKKAYGIPDSQSIRCTAQK